jgi:mRNA-degrading endonuclease RelE of RelBE toxin-antitoxin system
MFLQPPAEKFVKKIKDDKLKQIIKEKLLAIKNNPYIGEAKKGDLSGLYCLDAFYNKTNYEIAYRIYEGLKKVVIIMIGTRENFYKELKRFI